VTFQKATFLFVRVQHWGDPFGVGSTDEVGEAEPSQSGRWWAGSQKEVLGLVVDDLEMPSIAKKSSLSLSDYRHVTRRRERIYSQRTPFTCHVIVT